MNVNRVPGGVPCIRGTYVPLSVLVGRIADGVPVDDLMADYPQIAVDDVVEVAKFTAMLIDLQELPLEASPRQPYLPAGEQPDDASPPAARRRTGETRTEILGAELMVCPDDVAVQLELPRGGWVIRRRRLHVDAGGPAELATAWFDGRLADQALRLLVGDEIREGEVAYVEQATRRRPATTHEVTSIRHARLEERRILGLAGSRPPVVVTRRVVCDTDGRPIELLESVTAQQRWAASRSGATAQPRLPAADDGRFPAAALPAPDDNHQSEAAGAGQPLAGEGVTVAAVREWFERNGAWFTVSFLGLLLVVLLAVLVIVPLSWAAP